MREFETFEIATGKAAEQKPRAQAVAHQAGGRKIAGQHQYFARTVALELERLIAELRIQRDRLIGRQRPGRSGPDHH